MSENKRDRVIDMTYGPIMRKVPLFALPPVIGNCTPPRTPR